MVAIKIDASEIIQAAADMMAAGAKTEAAVVSGMNKAGDMGFTAASRELRKQTGISMADTKRSKGLAKSLARPGDLAYEMLARAPWTPLSYFKPKQGESGVMASPWGRRQFFKRTFMATMRSGHVGVYVRKPGVSRRVTRMSRTTGKSYQSEMEIRELWGPNLAEELVREPVPTTFRSAIADNLPRLINHEVERILAGIGGRKKPRAK
jgi:hypothetical protein